MYALNKRTFNIHETNIERSNGELDKSTVYSWEFLHTPSVIDKNQSGQNNQ